MSNVPPQIAAESSDSKASSAEITVQKPPVTFTFEVVGLLNNRVGAKLVPNYLKNITAPEQYQILEMARIGGFVKRQKGLGRPTKKDGREMKEFTDEAFFGFDDFDDENPLWTEEDEQQLEQQLNHKTD